MGKQWILFFSIIWVISVVTVFSDKCPTGPNDRTNITLTFTPTAPSVTWRKNNASIAVVSRLGCVAFPSTTDYNFNCENNGGKYTLEVLHPVDGDVFDTVPGVDSKTIAYQEPATMTVEITSPVTVDTVLHNNDKIIMEGPIGSCTKPQPNIKWQYMYTTDGVTNRTTISNTYIQSTLNDTGCTGTFTKINSKVEIFRASVPITDVPFKVECVLSYDVCTDNTYETTTPYTITITGNSDPVVGSPGLTTGQIIGIIVGVVIVLGVLIGIAVWWIRKKKDTQDQPPAVPDPPLDINYKTRGADNIVVTWRAGGGNGGGPQTFIVQQSQDNKRWTDSTTKPIPLTEYSIENLQPDTTYYIRVIATNKHGDSDPEKGIVLLVRTKKRGPPEPPKPQAIPDPPMDIKYKTRGTDNIVVTWRPSGNGGDQQQFIVQQSKDNKHWTDSTTKPIPLNEYSIQKLQPDTAYYIRVVARNKHGDSQPEQGIVLLIRTKKQDSSPTAVGKRRREDPENGVELTDRVRTPLNS